MNTMKDFLEIISNNDFNPNALVDKMPNGTWAPTSNTELLEKVSEIAAFLKSLGLKKGDKVAIYSPPFSRWLIVDLAITSIGCISLPIYSTASNDNFSFFITSTETKVIFFGSHECEDLCKNFRNFFEFMISLDDESKVPDAILYSQAANIGRKELSKNPAIIEVPLESTDVCSIMFTSGSGAMPKGVILSHRNLLCQLENISNQFFPGEGIDARYLNFMPLAHIFGRLMNMTYLSFGGCIFYSRDITSLMKDCKETQPTALIFLPRLMEKVANTCQKQIEEASFLKRTLGTWAYNLAKGDPESLWFKICKPLADIILYSKIRNLFGEKVRLRILGSSKSDRELLNLFNNMGFHIIEGYGLTEACPVCSTTLDCNKIGTVGKPFPGVEIKISDAGEILVRGELVMQGYYNNPEITKATIDEEGWLHTRDMGAFDEEGNLLFINRFDDQAKTSYGVFIDAPKIERMINRLPFVNFSVVIASNRPYVTALIFPDFEGLQELKKQLSLQDLSDQDLMNIEFMKKTVERSIKELNKKLDDHENIRAYRFIFETSHGDHLTPTMKLRRKNIAEKYQHLINEMYPEKILNV